MSLRIPLRPLTRILDARRRGENPDNVERENLRLRHEAMRDRMRVRAESRVLLVALCFILAFGAVGTRMAALATSEPTEPRIAVGGPTILNTRADIVDRQGRILATNFATNALYAHPQDIIYPRRAADGLAAIFPEMDADELYQRFTSDRRFIWLRRYISPEQEQMVHDIGSPGLLFGPREMRLYPNGSIMSHVLGGAGFGEEAVNAAEVIGIAGVEAELDADLRDPARTEPLMLSLDLTIQSTVEEVLHGAMVLMNARGAAAVLMDVHTGEVISMASLPDFDPNARPRPLLEGDQADDPLFNRAVQGVYELGSVFKTFAIAQALELNLYSVQDMIDTTGPLRMAGFAIRDFRSYGAELSVADVLIHSSNIGTARMAQTIGGTRQRDFLGSLGLLEPTEIELVEGESGRPLVPSRWGELATMTISYGHGLSTSPLHLAAAYSTMVNGGTLVTPTLLRTDVPQAGDRIVSEDTSAVIRQLLRQVVTEGTASFGEVEGYFVGGKTGTADMPRRSGGYYDDRNLNTFASAFPMHDPQYVLIVTLQEAVELSGPEPRRTAGWTAVPVAAEIIRRTGPLLGLRPDVDHPMGLQLSSSSN